MLSEQFLKALDWKFLEKKLPKTNRTNICVDMFSYTFLEFEVAKMFSSHVMRLQVQAPISPPYNFYYFRCQTKIISFNVTRFFTVSTS